MTQKDKIMQNVFKIMKNDACESIQDTKTMTEFRNQLMFILDEWDFTEEWKR